TERCLLKISGITPNINLKVARLGLIFQLGIIKPKLININCKTYLLALALFQKYFLKTLQFFYRPDYRPNKILYIKLHSFFALIIASVGYRNCCFDWLIRPHGRTA